MIKTIQTKMFGSCVELSQGGLKALVSPKMGMALVDFSIHGEQILDLSRTPVFLTTRKGLGPLILPHFNHSRAPAKVDPADFPHVAPLFKMGVKDPFQHGVGRYVPWAPVVDNKGVAGRISGEDVFGGRTLKDIEGFGFEAEVGYFLIDPEGLEIRFRVKGESPLDSGIHFYYDLKDRSAARIVLQVRESVAQKPLTFSSEWDHVFHPATNKGDHAEYLLETSRYRLKTRVKVAGPLEETFDSVTVFSPKNESFVCVEPLFSAGTRPPEKTLNQGSIFLFPEKRAF